MTRLAHHDRSQIWTCNNNNQASKKYFCDHLSTTLAWEDFFALDLSIVSAKHKSCIVFSINLLVIQCSFRLLSWLHIYTEIVYCFVLIRDAYNSLCLSSLQIHSNKIQLCNTVGREPFCRINMIIQNLEIKKKSRLCHQRLLNIIMANLTAISLPIPDTDWKRSVQEMWRCS